MKNITSRIGFARLPIAAGALVIAAGAYAGEPERFQWSPSALSSMEGIVATHERIESQAARYCRAHLRGTRGLAAQSSCEKAVVSEIVERIGDQRLTAYANTGKVDAELLARR